MTLNKCYSLERDGRAYWIDSISDRVVHIGAKILLSKLVRKNARFNAILGWLHVLSYVREAHK